MRRPPGRHRLTWWLAVLIALPAANCSTESLPGPSVDGSRESAALTKFVLIPTVAFTSTRDGAVPTSNEAAEIYFMNEDLTNVRRITENEYYDAFAAISPDGKKAIFDSNAPGGSADPKSTNPDLWIMKTDGTERAYLDHGASGTWSRDGKSVAYHASASGTGTQIRGDPSAATIDSDIFTLHVDDALAGVALRVNLTNSPHDVDEDPDWSPTADVIAYASHAASSNQTNPTDAEIYVRNADGTGVATRLTSNSREERAPSWSPDGTKILYMCREVFDDATQTSIIVGPDFEICVMNADGTGQSALTNNTIGDLTPNWSTDGAKIFFHRNVSGFLQLFVMNVQGTEVTQITSAPGHNAFANPGSVRMRVPE
jgi:TolB protein